MGMDVWYPKLRLPIDHSRSVQAVGIGETWLRRTACSAATSSAGLTFGLLGLSVLLVVEQEQVVRLHDSHFVVLVLHGVPYAVEYFGSITHGHSSQLFPLVRIGMHCLLVASSDFSFLETYFCYPMDSTVPVSYEKVVLSSLGAVTETLSSDRIRCGHVCSCHWYIRTWVSVVISVRVYTLQRIWGNRKLLRWTSMVLVCKRRSSNCSGSCDIAVPVCCSGNHSPSSGLQGKGYFAS